MVGLGKVWDILGQVVNYEISLGFQTQDGANTFSMISIVFYALGTLFLLAGGYNVIAESKKYRNRGV
jgi:hypothetical protein